MREHLATKGILYPGPDINHVPEFLAPLDFPAPRYMEEEGPQRWRSLCDSVALHDGTVLLSSEIVCSASIEQGRSLVRELGVGETRVILTIRSLHSLLPSTWQEYVKAGDTLEYEEWLDVVFAGPPVYDTHQFWIANNLGDVVERWTAIVGADNLTVVVLDPHDNGRIFRDFESILGFDRGFLIPPPPDLANRSMTVEESELIRRINLRVRGDQPGQHGYEVVPLFALWSMLERMPGPDEARLGLGAHHHELADRLSRDFVDRITETGCHIIGRLEDLCPDFVGTEHAPLASDDLPIGAAVSLAAALLHLMNTAS